ncbi:ribosome biogenesis GTPase A [Chitiniphilus shinanonensis]|uniref:Ribosome biogenesis GTPase A n=1 Tax=Chitiniphilus shinanonensis TaxID=553088 RepID=A0ABQ6BM41_9NEIS|nr:ribosome biogenesis GTPase YlqF [Chitiniphilus shinanonensis]GLS03013.1 ribosome biogenesis GTPase A [Chitiniphilus shinanonensis]
MSIQWYPGHMHAARKQIAETLAKVDLVIEVLDARLPGSSTNPMIEQLRRARQRPALKILNKADLADPALNTRWLEWFRAQPSTAAILMGEDNKQGQARKLPSYCRELAPHRTGAEKPLRALIMGIPNVGKSTLLNVLMSRRIANVADTPGVTKSQQRVETGEGFILYDTPGLLWPKIERPESGYRLALAGSVGRNAYNEEDVAWFAVETLQQRYPRLLAERYKLDEQTLSLPADQLFEVIGRKRGAMLGGGRIDRQKTAELILTDFRSGILGRITLETPDDFLLPPEPLAPTDHSGDPEEDQSE